MVTSLPLLKDFNRVCEGCVVGKQHKLPFPVGKSQRATQQLEIVYSDLCGPMETVTTKEARAASIVCDQMLPADLTCITWRMHGIRHQLTASYTQQQNGVVKRKNWTIVEMARSKLNYKSFPKIFWAEAVACAGYILNRSPTSSVLDMTPEEAWSGDKPDVAALRVCGSIAYAHVLVEKRQKLDVKVDKN